LRAIALRGAAKNESHRKSRRRLVRGRGREGRCESLFARRQGHAEGQPGGSPVARGQRKAPRAASAGVLRYLRTGLPVRRGSAHCRPRTCSFHVSCRTPLCSRHRLGPEQRRQAACERLFHCHEVGVLNKLPSSSSPIGPRTSRKAGRAEHARENQERSSQEFASEVARCPRNSSMT
jgi:hypothetical protein